MNLQKVSSPGFTVPNTKESVLYVVPLCLLRRFLSRASMLERGAGSNIALMLNASKAHISHMSPATCDKGK